MTKSNTGAATARELLMALAMLVAGTGLIVALTFWINPVLGTLTSLLLAFVWTFSIAPEWIGRMLGVLIVTRRERQRNRRMGGKR